MTFYYKFLYDAKDDSFYGYVDEGKKERPTIFEIYDSQSMVKLIQNGTMKHIDDIEGLTKYLKQRNLIKQHDRIKLSVN